MTSSFDCVQAQFRSPIDQSALLFFGRKQHVHNFPTEGVELKEKKLRKFVRCTSIAHGVEDAAIT